MRRSVILIAHNLRSCHNVGSLLRTAEGLGVDEVILSGYTPYPQAPIDSRLPHLSQKLSRQIHKTALGAEHAQAWRYEPSLQPIILALAAQDYVISALEQTPQAIDLHSFSVPDRLALIVGREVDGIEPDILELATVHLQIPMLGQKESFNVVQAAAMALYHLRFDDR